MKRLLPCSPSLSVAAALTPAAAKGKVELLAATLALMLVWAAPAMADSIAYVKDGTSGSPRRTVAASSRSRRRASTRTCPRRTTA